VSAQSPEDRELEALLARDGRLGRAWREVSREEPPPALDDAVRAAARRAVHAGPRSGHGPFARRWRVPLSIAAVLVVSATLTLLVAERREHVPRAGLDGAPAAPATEQAPPAEERKLAEPEAPARDAAPRVTVPTLRKQSTAEPARVADESRKELYDAPAEAPETAAPPAASETPSIPSAPAPPATAFQPAATVAASSRASEQPAAPPVAAQSKPDARVGEQVSAAAKKAVSPQAFPEREEARADARAKASVEATAGEAGKREPLQARGATQRAAEPALDPKTWIERILTLRREGKLQEADRSLQEFRRRYPDYSLPPELARLPTNAPADIRQ
jgi:hypothetical protein